MGDTTGMASGGEAECGQVRERWSKPKAVLMGSPQDIPQDPAQAPWCNG